MIAESELTATHECLHGKMSYFKNDTIIGKSLEAYGEWSEYEIELLNQFIKPDDVVIEIGANIGTHTLPFAKAVGKNGLVIAFEAQRLNFQILCSNVILNDHLNVNCFHLAIGKQSQNIPVPQFDPRHAHNFGSISVAAHQQGEVIRMVSLDDLRLEKCNLIKLDVEGIEADVLIGARDTIERLRPFIFLENNKADNAHAINKILHDYHYNCWWFFCPHFRPNNFRGNPDNIFSDFLPETSMICIPQEIHANINLLPLLNVNETHESALERIKALQAGSAQ